MENTVPGGWSDGDRPRLRTGSAGWAVAAGILCVALNVAAASAFLPRQSFWNDEATQMVGLSLDPIGVVRWLAGYDPHDFGVSDDRMPPLSYWVGWLWSRLFGVSELAMRWLSVVCVAAATALVFEGGRRTWGLIPALAAGLIFGLSPNVIVQAVEIRAYSLLLLTSAGCFFCLSRLLIISDSETLPRNWLVGLVVCGIAAMYSHFFGLVVCGGTLLTVLISAVVQGQRLGPPLAAIVAAGVAAMGLTPFVLASASLSGEGAGNEAAGKLKDLIRLTYRVIAHPATSVSRVALASAGIGAALTISTALASARRDPVIRGLIVAIGSGLAVVVVTHLAQSAFAAASPHYNSWMLPGIALLLSSGLASRSRIVWRASALGVSLLIAANFYAVGQLAIHGEYFAHGPHRQIRDLIDQLGPERVTIIHDDPIDVAWTIYAPLHYDYGGAVPQFVLEQLEPIERVAPYPARGALFDPTELPAEYIVVVRSRIQWASEVVDQIHSGDRSLAPGPVSRSLETSGRWRRVHQTTHISFVAADLDVFRRVDPVPSRSR